MMKNIITKTISLIVLICTISGAIKAMSDLQGSYTSLPDELKPLSLLNGGLIGNVDLLSNIYKEKMPIAEVNKGSISLVRGLFFIIDQTEEFKLSSQNYQAAKDSDAKAIQQKKDDFVDTLINNLAYLFLTETISKKLQNIINSNKEKKNLKKTQTGLQKTISNNLKKLGQVSVQTFKQADWSVSRLAMLAALWDFRKNVQSFDYLTKLKEHLTSACDTILKENKKLPKEIIEEIKSIKTITNEIQTTITTSPDGFEELFKEEHFEDLTAGGYEALINNEVQNLLSGKKHPEAIKQAPNKAHIIINGKKVAFHDCMETVIRNLINYLAFDPNKKTLSAEQLQTKSSNHISQEITKFYTKYNNINKQRNSAAYNEWAQIVSNQKNIRYGQSSNNDETQNNYNMEPTWANLLIIINSLLGSPLFEEPENYPKDPVDFTNNHLEEFINLFGKSTIKQFSAETGRPQDDNPDKINGILPILNQEDEPLLTIYLTIDHGYMKYPKTTTLNATFSAKLFDTYPLIWFITSPENWPNTPLSILPIFNLDLKDYNTVAETITNLSTIPLKWIRWFKKYIDQQPDETIRIRTELKLYERVLNDNPHNNINSNLKNNLYKDIAERTTALAAKDTHHFMVITILNIFDQLAKQYTDFDLIRNIPIAVKILTKRDFVTGNREEYDFFKTILSQDPNTANLILEEMTKNYSKEDGKIDHTLPDLVLATNTKLKEDSLENLINTITEKIESNTSSWTGACGAEVNLLTKCLTNEQATSLIKDWLEDLYINQNINQKTKEIGQAGKEIFERILEKNPQDPLAEKIILDFLTTRTLKAPRGNYHGYRTYIARLLDKMAISEEFFNTITTTAPEKEFRLWFLYSSILERIIDEIEENTLTESSKSICKKILTQVVLSLPNLSEKKLNKKYRKTIYKTITQLIDAIYAKIITATPQEISIIKLFLNQKQKDSDAQTLKESYQDLFENTEKALEEIKNKPIRSNIEDSDSDSDDDEDEDSDDEE